PVSKSALKRISAAAGRSPRNRAENRMTNARWPCRVVILMGDLSPWFVQCGAGRIARFGWHWWLIHQCSDPGRETLVGKPPVPPRKWRYDYLGAALARSRKTILEGLPTAAKWPVNLRPPVSRLTWKTVTLSARWLQQ